VGPTPLQLREGSHIDPDGNLIRFRLADGGVGPPAEGPRLSAAVAPITGHQSATETAAAGSGSRVVASTEGKSPFSYVRLGGDGNFSVFPASSQKQS